MRTVGEVLPDRLAARITDEMVEEAAAYREDPAALARAEEQPGGLEGAAPADWRDAISGAGYDFIVRWETGGRAYYEKVIRERPIWPGYASGITIGCGFDLGYHTREAFLTEWKGRLGAAALDRLATVTGFRTVAPDRAARIEQARALVRRLSDIVVPWQTAIAQFDEAKLPRLVGQLYASLANVGRLHPHCRAALLSLIFNRGASFRAAGERYAEMRAIAAAMRDPDAGALQGIPDLLRAMKRIWGDGSSLAERREGEARLFEAGLQEAALLESVSGRTQAQELESALPPAGMHGAEQHEDVDAPPSDEADEDEVAESARSGETLESGAAGAAAVRWHPQDDEQPDYRHLDRTAAGSSFELTPDDLDLLLEANEFATRPGKLLFALRGAALADGGRTGAASIVITDQRPDHRRFRCVMGVYDRDTRRLSAFPASTVPNAHYVFRCQAMASQGTPLARLTGNILPTGCYTYTVGTHRRGQDGEIPGVLRLSTTATGASQVVVLRSLSDLRYDRFDPFMVATPADNIHPGQLAEGFSSAGCLTLPGRYAAGRHSGTWDEFRHAAGLDDAADGTQYSLMLLTGLDAINAARVRTGLADAASLRRLRHGSRGARVAALQAALGLQPDPSQLIGPVTRKALVQRQTHALGWADGIYSPAMDALLGLRIYANG